MYLLFMQKYGFAIRVSIIMTVLMALIGYMAIYAYERFSETTNEIQQDLRPDLRLVTAKSLLNSINDAELHVKSFRITDDPDYLANFYTAVQQVETKLANFHSYTTALNEEANLVELDALDTLINQKIEVLNELLFLQDGIRTQKALDEVVEKIELSTETDTIVKNNGATDDDKKLKRGWLFKKRKVEEPEDSIIKVDVVRVEKISDDLSDIRRKEMRYTRAYKEREIALIVKDEVISKKINAFFDDFEIEERNRLKENTLKTEKNIQKTNRQIAWLCTVAGLLLLIMAAVIISYVRKNQRYQNVLHDAKIKAEEMSEARKKFLANMSHEIRTPLNAIIGFSEQIGTQPLNNDQEKYLGMVKKSSDHLLHVVNEVLDFSKLQESKIQLEKIPFSTTDLFKELDEYLKMSLVASPVNYAVDVDPKLPAYLLGDLFRLRQIIYNLLSNALKFTANGEIKIAVDVKQLGTQQCIVELSVSDTGIGIDEQHINKIFEDFEQATAGTSRNYGGTGLGLSIVKLLVDLHKGELNVTSELGKGTTFSIELNYEIGEKQQEDHPLPASTPFLSKNNYVLIADDEDFNRKLLISILKKHNVRVDEAVNGQEALEKVKANNYDVLLTDIRMPLLTGKELTTAIRSLPDPQKNKLSIIALTAAVSEEDIADYHKIGFNDTLPKPYNENQLIALLKKHITSTPVKSNQPIDEAPADTALDFSQLKSLSGSDDDFYYDMIQTFITGTSTGVAELIGALEEKNHKQAREIAHKIATPCNHMGAKMLYGILKEIENQVQKTGQVSEISQKIIALNKATTSALKLATEELNKR